VEPHRGGIALAQVVPWPLAVFLSGSFFDHEVNV
jgi:hypothetical protein